MTEKSFRILTPDALDDVAQYVSEREKMGRHIALEGPLGCGKTEWTRRFLHFKGVTGPVVSPTFTYCQEYRCGKTAYFHFDLYRISSVEEFFLIGGEEALSREDCVCIIEWPEVISSLLSPDSVIRISFSLSGDGCGARDVVVKIPDGRH